MQRTTTARTPAWMLLAMAAAMSSASAANHTWVGATSGIWEDASNWSPVGVPGSGDEATFGSTTQAAITIASAASVAELNFLLGAPAYTIHISSGGLYSNIVNTHSSTLTAYIVDSGTALHFGSGSLGAGTIENAGSLQIFTSDAAQMVATNAATGDLDVSGGSSHATSLASVSGPGSIHLGATVLTLGGSGSDATLSGSIADGGAAGGSGGALTKTGGGTLILSGANTYTGQTTVAAGTLNLQSDLAGKIVIDTGAFLRGSSHTGDLVAQAGSQILPGNASAHSSLSGGQLVCASSPLIVTRIGNVGGASVGTYLSLAAALQTGLCPHLNFHFASAGTPLAAADLYPLVTIAGTTDYTTANLSYDFTGFPAHSDASGQFVVSSTAASSTIFFLLNDVGNEIFKDGFD